MERRSQERKLFPSNHSEEIYYSTHMLLNSFPVEILFSVTRDGKLLLTHRLGDVSHEADISPVIQELITRFAGKLTNKQIKALWATEQVEAELRNKYMPLLMQLCSKRDIRFHNLFRQNVAGSYIEALRAAMIYTVAELHER